MTDTDDEGYRTVKSTPVTAEKGIKCGDCGMKFDHGRAYGYWCPRENCPVQCKPRMSSVFDVSQVSTTSGRMHGND